MISTEWFFALLMTFCGSSSEPTGLVKKHKLTTKNRFTCRNNIFRYQAWAEWHGPANSVCWGKAHTNKKFSNTLCNEMLVSNQKCWREMKVTSMKPSDSIGPCWRKEEKITQTLIMVSKVKNRRRKFKPFIVLLPGILLNFTLWLLFLKIKNCNIPLKSWTVRVPHLKHWSVLRYLCT